MHSYANPLCPHKNTVSLDILILLITISTMAQPKILVVNAFIAALVPISVRDKLNASMDFYIIEQAKHDVLAEEIASAVEKHGPFIGCVFFFDYSKPLPWPLDEQLLGPLVNTGCRFFSGGGSGYEFVDVAYLTRNGAYWANNATASGVRTADSACMMILQVLRNTSRRELDARSGKWQDFSYLGQDARISTLGIIGMGSIGRRVGKIMSSAFGMEIIYYNRNRLTEEEEVACGGGMGQAEYVSLDEILNRSDVLSIHCLLTKETTHLIDREAFNKMKHGARIVNTARGAVIHEEALVEALESGKVRCAALDVFEFEPKIHPRLVEMTDRTILQPHSAVFNNTAQMDLQLEILDNLETFIVTGKPKTPVNDPVISQ